MWVPNPKPYPWGPTEVNSEGVPFVKDRIVVLDRINEKGEVERKRFSGQEAVDAAWAKGWHDTGRPETADVIWDEVAEPKPEIDLTKPVEKMIKTEKVAYGETFDPPLELHMDMTHAEMDLFIQAAEENE